MALAILAAAAMAAAVAAYVWREPIVTQWWAYVGARPLTEAQASALLACDDPGWNGLVKVLEQDLDVACDPGWLTEAVGRRLTGRRVEWLRARAIHPGRPPRERVRAGLALLFSGHPPIRGLALLLSEPTTPAAERELVLQWLGEQPTIGEWVDPSLRTEVLVQRLREGDLGVAPEVARLLRLRSVLRGASADESAELVEASLAVMGLGDGRFDRLVGRRAAGLPLGDAPRALVRAVSNRGADCSDRGSAACLRFAADLLEAYVAAGADEEPEDRQALVEPGVLAPLALWEILYDGDAETIEAMSARFVETGDWIRRGEPEERAGRLLGQIAHPRHTYDAAAARAGRSGDPIYALLHRRASPWTSALAGVTLGEIAGVPVSVHAWADAVVLEVDGRRVAIGPCGDRVPPPELMEGEPWPRRAIVAQAAIEAAGGALRMGDGPVAHRLVALAERIDPIGASGSSHAVSAVAASAELPERAAGRKLGGMVGPPSRPADEEPAQTARALRAATWADVAASWSPEGERTGCPAPLGP